MSGANTPHKTQADDFDETWSEYSLWSHNATLENIPSPREPDNEACPEEASQAHSPPQKPSQKHTSPNDPALLDSENGPLADLNRSFQYSFLQESFVSRAGNESLADEVETQLHRIQSLEQKLRSLKSVMERMTGQQMTLLRWFASVPAFRPMVTSLQIWVQNPMSPEPDFLGLSSPKAKDASIILEDRLDMAIQSTEGDALGVDDFVDTWRNLLSKDIQQYQWLSERRLLKSTLAQYSGKLSALESAKGQLLKRIEGLEDSLEMEKSKNEDLTQEIEELKSNVMNRTFSEAVQESDMEELKDIIKKQKFEISQLHEEIKNCNMKTESFIQTEQNYISEQLEAIASHIQESRQHREINMTHHFRFADYHASIPTTSALNSSSEEGGHEFTSRDEVEQAPNAVYKSDDFFEARSVYYQSEKDLNHIEELEAENTKLRKDVNDLEAQLFNLVSDKLKWQMSRTDDADIPKDIEELVRKQFAESTVEISNLRTENKKLERNYQKALKDVSDKEKLIISLQQVWDQSQNPLDNIRGLQVKVANANRNYNEACKEIESLKAEMSIMSQQIDMLRAELRRYQSEAADKAISQAPKAHDAPTTTTATAATTSASAAGTHLRLNFFRSYPQPK